MPNFIKFLAEGRGLWDYKGLIWSHNPFLFDYQLLNWSLLNMAACEDVLLGLSDTTGSGTGLKIGRRQRRVRSRERLRSQQAPSHLS